MFIRAVSVFIRGPAVTVALAVQSLGAQGLTGQRSAWQLAPTFESWSFQQGTTENVESATQWTLPFVAMFDVARPVTIDVYGAYMAGEVHYRPGSPEASHAVSGFTDVRVRAAARLWGDGVVATFGIGVPTGKTRLDARELAALRVLGAPSLRAQTPSLGNGLTTTAGLVLTRRVGDWALGGGASYELRGEYSPVEAAALGLVELDPGEAVRASIGAERLLGESAMSMSLSAIRYSDDEVRGGGAAGCAEGCRYRLGPAVELEWQLRTVALGFREITLHLYDRYRTRYENAAGEKVDGSAANELDAGVQGSIALSRSVALVMALDGRHHTGLDVDETVATAAYAGGGATLGVGFGSPRLTVQPFVRGQLGRMRTGERGLEVTGWSGGVSMTSTF